MQSRNARVGPLHSFNTPCFKTLALLRITLWALLALPGFQGSLARGGVPPVPGSASEPATRTFLSCETPLLTSLPLKGYSDDLSVRLGSSQPGRHGGTHTEAMLTERFGDPRWMVHVLGKEVAEFLGFFVLSEDRMLVPDADELNGAIEKLNRLLPADHQVLYRFYMIPPTRPQQVSPSEYVREHAFGPRLPLASRGVTRIHDLSFHALAIALPNSLTRPSILLSRAVFDIQSAASQGASDRFPEATHLRRKVDLLARRRANQIDTGTGAFAFALATGAPLQHAIAPLTQQYLGWGLSRYEYLKRNLMARDASDPAPNESHLWNWTSMSLESIEDRDPQFTLPPIIREWSVCTETRQKIEAIRAAVETLNRAQP